MNFIIRNLGWILLIIFFTFMLYLISNQNNSKNVNNSNSWAIIETIEQTGAVLKKEENKLNVEKYNLDKYSLSKTGTIEIEEEKKEEKETSFFKDVKNIFSTDNEESEEKNNNDIEDKDDIIVMEEKINPENIDKSIKEKEEEIKNKENNKIEEKNNKVNLDENKKENNSEIKESNIKKEDVNTSSESELAIKEKIKQKIIEINKNRVHKVWVKSIFLNNAYFTKRLATAYKWDTLEQLTNTNKYGCFKTEVLEAKNTNINGLKAWTCIYYMEWFLGTESNYEVAAKIKNRNFLRKNRISQEISKKIEKRNKIQRAEDWSIIIKKDPNRVYEGPIYDTEVWSLYLVRVNSLKLNDETFTKKKAYLEECTSNNCDILEQLTPINEKGCFKVNVFDSKTNKDKRGFVCQKYLR